MNWSVGLQDKMALLSGGQQRAILMIVMGAADGIPLTRLLKTAYSCPHCGYVAGRSGELAEQRKAALADHIEVCEGRPKKWRFAVAASTYYNKWRPSAYFRECLSEAWEEFIGVALVDAQRKLRLTTLKAAWELDRQIEEGEKDFDKRSAAIAVLDRADMSTAAKADDKLMRLLAELRGVDDEEVAELDPEENGFQPDRAPAERDPGSDSP